MKTETLFFNGYEATVIRPESPNGKWIWKTEFLFAFDQAEQKLVDQGYTRFCYHISDKYGSYQAVRLMHDFYRFVIEKYGLESKGALFGFSRGGLYAFNFALFYPEYVNRLYLDAPVLDMRDWPPSETEERLQVYREYNLTPETLRVFRGHPIENIDEFFSQHISLLIVAGDSDEVVSFEKNTGRLLEVCQQKGYPVSVIIKENCGHHPHSLNDVTPIIDFITRKESFQKIEIKKLTEEEWK